MNITCKMKTIEMINVYNFKQPTTLKLHHKSSYVFKTVYSKNK